MNVLSKAVAVALLLALAGNLWLYYSQGLRWHVDISIRLIEVAK
jgi:hypothetical protein